MTKDKIEELIGKGNTLYEHLKEETVDSDDRGVITDLVVALQSLQGELDEAKGLIEDAMVDNDLSTDSHLSYATHHAFKIFLKKMEKK